MIARIARLRPGQQGSSLIEATLALGLMAAVLGSIAGLFMLGAGRVKSGRVSSQALAVARTILEEIESRNFRQTYEELGYDGVLSVELEDHHFWATAELQKEGLLRSRDYIAQFLKDEN